ncbi:hypothetical protein D3C72_1274290 [compost metagenome]
MPTEPWYAARRCSTVSTGMPKWYTGRRMAMPVNWGRPCIGTGTPELLMLPESRDCASISAIRGREAMS